MALSPPMMSLLWLLLRLSTLLLVVVNPLAQLALLLPQPQQSPTLPPQLLPPHLQSLLPQPLLLLQLLPPSMVDTLLLPQPMADMLALDTLVLLPPLVLDSQPPLMLLDNSTQLPSPTCMMLPEMLAVMLPLPLMAYVHDASGDAGGDDAPAAIEYVHEEIPAEEYVHDASGEAYPAAEPYVHLEPIAAAVPIAAPGIYSLYTTHFDIQ